jgi:hypothetical protein
MLNLKMIWSSTATLGILFSIAQGAAPMAWAFTGIFAGSCGVWSYGRLRLRPNAPAVSHAQEGPVQPVRGLRVRLRD